MSKVRDIARQIVDALPDDADFDDLDEFLWERVDVEHGRDDFDEGRIEPFRNIDPEAKAHPGVSALRWSEHAAESYRKTKQNWKSRSPAELEEFSSAVLQALESLNESLDAGINLPEMGDSSIRELRARVKHIAYRIIYDVNEGHVRTLWFTDNKTCYRNIIGYPADEQ